MESPRRGGFKRPKAYSNKEPLNLEQLKEEVNFIGTFVLLVNCDFSHIFQVKTYQEIFTKLKQETNAQDINEMVQNFVEQEDNNYSLFNYLNVLSDEVSNKLRT